MAVEVGSEAPDFTLNDYNKQPVKLSSFRGDKPVLWRCRDASSKSCR